MNTEETINEEIKMKNIEEIKKDAADKAADMVKKMNEALPVGFVLKRVENKFHKFAFDISAHGVVQCVSSNNCRSLVDLLPDGINTIEKRIESQVYEDALVAKINKLVPITEPTEEEKEILRLEDEIKEEMVRGAIAVSLDLKPQVVMATIAAMEKTIMVEIVKHGGRIIKPGGKIEETRKYCACVPVEEYDRYIPLGVLKTLEKHTKEGFFEKYEIWVGDDDDDPLLVGVKNCIDAVLAKW